MKYYQSKMDYNISTGSPSSQKRKIVFFMSSESQLELKLKNWFYENMNFNGNTLIGSPEITEISEDNYSKSKSSDRISL